MAEIRVKPSQSVSAKWFLCQSPANAGIRTASKAWNSGVELSLTDAMSFWQYIFARQPKYRASRV